MNNLMPAGNLIARISLLLLLIRLFGSFVFQSVTMDEFGHVPAGFNLLKTGDFRYCELNPPLANAISALPLLFLDAKRADAGSQSHEFWRNGYSFMTKNSDGYQGMFLASRFMTMVATLLLGFLVFHWANRLYPSDGNLGGGLAFFLFALCPNVAAHGTLATTDMFLTASTVLAVFTYWRLLKAMTLPAAVLCGACLGVAQLTKFSALLLYPVMCLIHLLRMRSRPEGVSLTRYWLLLGVAFCASLLLLHAAYLFTEPRMLLPGGFLDALLRQIADNAAGDQSYLLGESYVGTMPHYFLVAMLVKTPVPALAAIGLAAYLAISGKRRGDWRDEIVLLAPAALFLLYFSLLSRKQIGLRLILPVYPLMYIYGGRAAQWLSQRASGVVMAASLALWYILSAAMTFPHHISYFNELSGGSGAGLRYLADSNLDWGQDLLGLRRYMKDRGIEELSLAYFGRAAPEIYGIKYSAAFGKPASGTVAVSASLFTREYILWDHGLRVRVKPEQFAWARSLEPAAKIGGSIYVYELGDGK